MSQICMCCNGNTDNFDVLYLFTPEDLFPSMKYEHTKNLSIKVNTLLHLKTGIHSSITLFAQ